MDNKTKVCTQILSRTNTITQHHKELSRILGEDFNVFKIVKIFGDELRHSAFIAELLNPKGSHGQGELFLKLFLDKLGIEKFYSKTAQVEVEKFIGSVSDSDGGRIDICVDDRRGNKITIENKIFANDQNSQLIRYYNYTKSNLYYLTLNGDDASSKSVKNENIHLIRDKDYKLLSYKSDILDWLERCQKEAYNKPLLREGIAHYINLIKQLIGETTNQAMKDEIIRLIAENPAYLSNAREIANNLEEAKIFIFWKFMSELKDNLTSKGIELVENDRSVTEDRIVKFYRKKDRYFGFWSKIYQKDDITVHWGLEVDDDLYFGFTIESNGQGGISNLPEYHEYRRIIKECDITYRDSQWWLGVQETKPELNFREFNSDAIFSLADKKVSDQIVEAIATKVFRDIQTVKMKLEKLNDLDPKLNTGSLSFESSGNSQPQ